VDVILSHKIRRHSKVVSGICNIFFNRFTDESDINNDIKNIEMSLMGVNEEEGTTLRHFAQTSHHARGYHCARGGPHKRGEHCTD
jgi:hypothetical protein